MQAARFCSACIAWETTNVIALWSQAVAPHAEAANRTAPCLVYSDGAPG
jgi:hypothetical protein